MQIDLGFFVALAGVAVSVGTLLVSAKKSEVEEWDKLLESLREEYERLKREVQVLRQELCRMRARERKLRVGIRVLIEQLEELGVIPVWRPEDDDELMEEFDLTIVSTLSPVDRLKSEEPTDG